MLALSPLTEPSVIKMFEVVKKKKKKRERERERRSSGTCIQSSIKYQVSKTERETHTEDCAYKVDAAGNKYTERTHNIVHAVSTMDC